MRVLSHPSCWLLALGAACLSVALAAPAALAHATLVGSSPAAGANLAAAPAEVDLRFSEPLNRDLSSATLTTASGRRRIEATTSRVGRSELVLRPKGRLSRTAYRVAWHSVSSEDGHALDGSFGFGVGTAAVGGSRQVEQSPLASAGWLRVGVRGFFYALVVFFAGGVMTGALLSRPGRPADWLMPHAWRNGSAPDGKGSSPVAVLVWRRTVTAGWLAAGAAGAVALADAAHAGGGLSARAVSSFLLSDLPGLARVACIGLLVAAAGLAIRDKLRLAASCTALALGAVVLSGHANSADPRAAALSSDWLHLLAASVWIGGVAQIALTWAPRLVDTAPALRRAVMRDVLARFGRLALPAFALLAASGLINALIQVGRVGALWQTGYGRVLTVKIGLIALIALASYTHAIRLRPRLANEAGERTPDLERRHWRLLRIEPLLGLGVAAAAALLAGFPLPPRQLAASAPAQAPSAASAAICNRCAPATPTSRQLAVADNVGSSIAALWLEPARHGLQGRLRMLDQNLVGVRTRPIVAGARLRGCGHGCWDISTPERPASLSVSLAEGGRLYTTRLPTTFLVGRDREALRLVEQAQETMRKLRSVREAETISSGPGALAATSYELQAPDRFSYSSTDHFPTGASQQAFGIVVGQNEWQRAGPTGQWQEQEYGGGPPPFSTRSWFAWTQYARTVRLLSATSGTSRAVAEVALMDPDPSLPIWFRLRIDLQTRRVLAVRMIAQGHFMTQRFFAFNQPLQIEPPDGR